jgi:AraC family ethanolamine operon transcriptional activator
MSKAVHQTGVSPRGFISIGLPCRQSLSTWQGQNMGISQLVSFGTSQEFDGVSSGEFRGLTISIDVHKVERLADMLGMDIPDALLGSSKFSPDPRSQNLVTLFLICSKIMDGNDTPVTQVEEEEVISNLLIAATSSDQTADLSSPRSRTRAVDQAIDIMMSSENQSVTIGWICQEIGVSWRTLDRAFSEKFGIGPKDYFLRLRLNRVRADLLRRSGADSISNIANERGYWHLGQFARDYVKMFGELPSKTILDSR